MKIDKKIVIAKVKERLKKSKNEENIKKIINEENEKEVIGYVKKLLKNPKENVVSLEALANYKEAPPKVLLELAKCDLGEIRWKVLKNENITKDVIMALVKNKDYKPSQKISIYDKIASHSETPKEALKILAEDKSCDEYRAKNIIRHKNVSEEVLKILAKNDERSVRQEVAKNKKTPLSILKDLSNDKEQLVRMDVWENAKIPDSMAKQIADTLPPSWTGSDY